MHATASPEHLRTGRSWVAQSSHSSRNHPASWQGPGVPTTTVPCSAGGALLRAAPGCSSCRCEQRLHDSDGAPWEFTSQLLAVAGLVHLPCPYHCDGASAWLTPAILQSPLVTLLPTPRHLQRCLWGRLAAPPEREDSQHWGWVSTGSDELALMTTVPPPWRRSMVPGTHDPVPASQPAKRSRPLRGGHCSRRSPPHERHEARAGVMLLVTIPGRENHLTLCGTGAREGESHQWWEDGSGP